jgi:dTDP-4-amino-4,6-dideoxygalactose transaminase
VQLARLDDTVARSRRAHARVKDAVSVVVEERGCAFRAVVDAAGEIGIALVLLLPDPARALAVAEALRAEGVDGACTLYSTDAIDYHVHAYWAGILARRFPERADEFAAERCPRTLHWLGRAVHLDVSPELADEVVDEIALAIEKVLRVLA